MALSTLPPTSAFLSDPGAIQLLYCESSWLPSLEQACLFYPGLVPLLSGITRSPRSPLGLLPCCLLLYRAT